MLTLRDIMTPEVITVGPDTPLAEVAQLLAAEGISGVPVVGTSRVLGVVSATDLMDFSAADTGEARELGGPVWDALEETAHTDSVAPFYYDPWSDRQVARGELDIDDDDAAAYGEFTASDIMTRTVCSLPAHTTLDDAGRYMVERGIHRVLVIDEGSLVGIVTSMDFVRVVAERSVAAD